MKEFSDFEAINRREHDLLAKTERPRNRLEHQMVLAEELYVRDFPSEAINVDDEDFRNRALNYWVDNKYAKAFGDLPKHKDFERHGRLLGNVLNVTLSDVEYFLNNHELPER
jgi:hypothetical protein